MAGQAGTSKQALGCAAVTLALLCRCRTSTCMLMTPKDCCHTQACFPRTMGSPLSCTPNTLRVSLAKPNPAPLEACLQTRARRGMPTQRQGIPSPLPPRRTAQATLIPHQAEQGQEGRLSQMFRFAKAWLWHLTSCCVPRLQVAYTAATSPAPITPAHPISMLAAPASSRSSPATPHTTCHSCPYLTAESTSNALCEAWPIVR